MARNTSFCSPTYFTIQRQRRTALYLFSVLISCFLSQSTSAQNDSIVKLVAIQNSNHLNTFFNEKAITENQPYRIVHFGDSHIQGDRITNEIRSNLQNLYGSGGSGMIFPYSLTGSFGPLGTKSSIKGNYSYASQLKNPSSRPIGIMGYELTLSKGAEFSISFNDKFNGKVTNEVNIWVYSTSDTLNLSFGQIGVNVQCFQLQHGVRKYQLISDQPLDTISFQATAECSLWGIEFVVKEGLIYQQNGVVGAQFTHLIKHETEVLAQLKQMNPNLLIFSYGTNESYSKIDTSRYENQVKIFLKNLRQELPQAGILVTNAPDTRSGGRTPMNEQPINRVLERVANDLGIAFYDANTAMGGWGALYAWNKKGYFNKDLLHFSSSGAQVFGKLLLNGLLTNLERARKLNERIKDDLLIAVPLNRVEQVATTTNPSSANSETVHQRKEPKYYIVKNGDTLSKIAQRTGRSVNELVKKNNLKSADRIKPGQRIFY